jgi:hypothetical protein
MAAEFPRLFAVAIPADSGAQKIKVRTDAPAAFAYRQMQTHAQAVCEAEGTILRL